MFHLKLDILRYLIVIKFKGTLANVPISFSGEFLSIVGNAVADRLPTVQARPWRKSLAEWNESGGFLGAHRNKDAEIPLHPWPIEAVAVKYQHKRSYGYDELVFLELKLIGNAADHGFFLEVLLPAMEEAGRTPIEEARHSNRLWGAYEISAVYIASGSKWRPIAEEGSIDLDYRPKPNQWIEDLKLVRTDGSRMLDKITWLTPFDPYPQEVDGEDVPVKLEKGLPRPDVIFDQLMIRLNSLTPGKGESLERLLDGFTEEEILLFEGARDVSRRIPVLRTDARQTNHFGRRRMMGTQIFATSIPGHIIPFLTLASILHIGRYTQYGFGTFIIE